MRAKMTRKKGRGQHRDEEKVFVCDKCGRSRGQAVLCHCCSGIRQTDRLAFGIVMICEDCCEGEPG